MIKDGLQVADLSSMNIDELEVELKQFTNKVNDSYMVYLINEEQGRGLDFPTNIEIEKNGGVYLIVTCLAQRFL
jgi:hypothetical protein